MSPKATAYIAAILAADGFILNQSPVTDYKTNEHTGDKPLEPEDTVLELFENNIAEDEDPDETITIQDLEDSTLDEKKETLTINRGEDSITLKLTTWHTLPWA